MSTEPVDPFTTLLAFFAPRPEWRVVKFLGRHENAMIPYLTMQTGDNLQVDFTWRDGYLSYTVTFRTSETVTIEKRGRIGSGVIRTTKHNGVSLCHLDERWYRTVQTSIAAIVADLTTMRDELQETLKRLENDEKDCSRA